MHILIAYLLGILTGIKRIDPVNKTKNTNDQGSNSPPVMRAVTVHIPPEIEAKKESKDRKKHTLDVGMAFVHTGTMLAVVWYAILTNQILKTTNATFGEVQKQTILQQELFDLEHSGQLDVSIGMYSLSPEKIMASLQIKPITADRIAKEISVYAVFESRPLTQPPSYLGYDVGAPQVATYGCNNLVAENRSTEGCVAVIMEMYPNQWDNYKSGKNGFYIRGHIKFHDGHSYQKFVFCRYISREDYATTNYMPEDKTGVALKRFSHTCEK